MDDIVQRNMIEIRKYGFGEELQDSDELSWSGIQFWQVVKQLANENIVSSEVIIDGLMRFSLRYFANSSTRK